MFIKDLTTGLYFTSTGPLLNMLILLCVYLNGCECTDRLYD